MEEIISDPPLRNTIKRVKILIWIMVTIGFISLLIFSRSEVSRRKNNPVITEGIITEKGHRAKTNNYVAYSFYVGKIKYIGSVPVQFCKGCKDNCCEIGAIVKVRYEKGNPENNDLIH